MTGCTTLFSTQTAWFSQSVSKHKIKLWREHGGKLDTLDHAQFVFSQNAEVPDTKRLYSSEAYLNEHLAIFHANYISDCVRCGDSSRVPVGKYFLPPLEIQQLVRKQMEFAWEKSAAEEESDGSHSGEAENNDATNKMPLRGESEDGCRDKQKEGDDYLDINSLPLITGIIDDCVPGKNCIEVYRKNVK